MKREECSIGQEVIWNRNMPWGPIEATIVTIFLTKARIGYHQQSCDVLKHNHYIEKNVSIKKLIPAPSNSIERNKLINELSHRKQTYNKTKTNEEETEELCE